MQFDRRATWTDSPPAPAWWEHPLEAAPDSLHRDPARFARKAAGLAERGRPTR